MTAKAGELRQIGVRLSIDHFGAGYFSFSDLKTLSVDRIKIDRSLIREVDQIPEIRAWRSSRP